MGRDGPEGRQTADPDASARTPGSVSRRRWLSTLGAVTGLGWAAGCNSQDDPTESRPPTSESTPSSTTTPGTTTPTPTATSGSTGTEQPTPRSETIEFDGGGAAAFSAALDRLRETPGGTLRIAPGTHRLGASEAPTFDYPRDRDRVHFDGTGLEDVTIAGPPPDDGTAEIVLTDPTRGFLLFRNATGATATDRPHGPHLRDLVVRHDPLPFTQGQIEALSDGRRTATVALESGFPTFEDPPFTAHEPYTVTASVFTQSGTRIRRVTDGARSNYKQFDRIEQVGDRRYRLTLADGVEPGGFRVGRRLAVLPRHQNATLFIHADLGRPTYERVTVRSTPHYAFEFNACARPVIRECVVAPADGSVLVATNADGIHCNNCSRGPLVAGCRIERTSDDAVAVDNELLAVREFVDDRTVRVYAGFGTRVGAGDKLLAASPRLERKGRLPPVTEVDERGGGVTTDPVNPEWIRFDEAVDERLAVGDALTGDRLQNAGTVVRDTTVRSTRARFVRFGGVTDGTIENNEFRGTNSDGVEVAAAADVRPGFSDLKGWSTDIDVRGNEILDVGLYGVPSGVPRAVHVGVNGGEGDAPASSTTGRPHRNVTIEENTIRRPAGHGVEIADTEGASVDRTTVIDPGRLAGPELGRYGLGLRHVRDTAVRNTRVETDDADTLGFGWRVDVDPLETSGNAFLVGGESRSPTVRNL